MKWLFIVLSFLVIFSCKKKDETTNTPPNPKVNEFYYETDTIFPCNSENTFNVYIETDSLYLGFMAEHKNCGDHFITTIPKNVSPGYYPFTAQSEAVFSIEFAFNWASENYWAPSGGITITENNSTEKYIKGTFEGVMGVGLSGSLYPIQLTNGRFKLYY